MHQLCPFLALAADGRTVVDGFDAGHRCHAITPPGPLDRARQAQLCLTEAHIRCERHAAAMDRRAAVGGPASRPTDLGFQRTRLVLEPESRRGRAGRRRSASRTGLWVGGGLLLAGGAAAVTLGAANGLIPNGSAATPTPRPTPALSASPSVSEPTVEPTPASVPPSPTPAGSVVATPTPAATQRTYIVQPGDTLNAIALRFGTTAQAIMAANGITDPNSLSIGQVLIIP